MNKNKGFNIIEVAISIMITSVAILMIIAIYTNIIKAQAKGIGKTVASSVAERVLQDLASQKHLNNIENSGKDIVNENIYYYHYKVQKINTDTNLFQIDIVVYWDLGDDQTDEKIQSLTEVKNSVRFSRLVMISNNDD